MTKQQVDRRGRLSVSLRLPEALVARLQAAADERGVERTWLAERLLAEALDALLPVSDFVLTRRPADLLRNDPNLPPAVSVAARYMADVAEADLGGYLDGVTLASNLGRRPIPCETTSDSGSASFASSPETHHQPKEIDR